MSQLPETSHALRQCQGDLFYRGGMHDSPNLRTGVPGLPIGDTEFNPSRDLPTDINFASAMGEALGSLRVNTVIPYRALTMNFVIDATKRAEIPQITNAKQAIADDVSFAFRGAVRDPLDVIRNYRIGYAAGQGELAIDPEHQPEAEIMALRGLTLVISDFRKLRFSPNSLDSTIAIIAKHPLERCIPADVGRLSIGGLIEVNTNKKRELLAVNDRLEIAHQETLAQLTSAGAQIVDVAIDPSKQHSYDIDNLDLGLANAIRQIAKHKH